mgnify:FL=1
MAISTPWVCDHHFKSFLASAWSIVLVKSWYICEYLQEEREFYHNMLLPIHWSIVRLRRFCSLNSFTVLHWYWYVILLDKTSAYVLTLWFPCHEIRCKSSDCELKKMVPVLVQHEWPEYQLWIHTFPSSQSIHATVTQFSAVHITHIPFTVIDAWIRLL